MKAAVRYYTQSGNTKKLAEAIAEELGVEAKSIDTPLEENVEKLFLCNSMYWAGVDKHVKEYVSANAGKIGEIVNVSTAALIESTYDRMKGVAANAGVKLSEKEYHCKGSFKVLHKGHPNMEDLDAARAFARDLMA